MNKTILIIMMLSSAMIHTGCRKNAGDKVPVIGKYTGIPENDLLDAGILNHFGRVSDPQVSPDGTKIVYGVTYTSIEQNKRNRELFVMNIDGSDNRRITNTSKSESNARWLDNDRILFLSEGKLWVMQGDGSRRK
ncbi:MAG: peptidase S9, partial [Bacteroidales bacterium]